MEKKRQSIRASLRLDGPPPARVIAATRQFLQSIYEDLLDDPDTSSRVALAAHELLENLAKYSSGGDMDLEVSIVRRDQQDFVRIRTRNRSSPEQLAALTRTLDEIRAARDPLSGYLDFIARSAQSDLGSGLGLARIRAEADMSLQYDITGTEVTVVAETSVPTR